MRIIVLDSNCEVRDTLRFALEYVGYSVLEAADAEAGLRLLREQTHPIIALLSHPQPGEQSEHVLATAARDDTLARRHAYIVLTTCPRRLTPTLTRLTAQLAAPVVRKPFDIPRLMDALDQAMSRLVVSGRDETATSALVSQPSAAASLREEVSTWVEQRQQSTSKRFSTPTRAGSGTFPTGISSTHS